MTNHIDTRDGWREVRTPPFEGEAEYLTLTTADDTEDRYWVREEPVPPLPTEPYTVIRVTWRDEEDDRLVDTLVRGDDQWSAVEADQWHTVRNLPDAITGFKVLAEPAATKSMVHMDTAERIRIVDHVRRETVETIINWLRGEAWANAHADDVANKFGVEL